MADVTYTIDVSDVVKAQAELKKWAAENKKAINTIKSDMAAESRIRQLGLKNTQAETKARLALHKQREQANKQAEASIRKEYAKSLQLQKLREAEAKKEAAAVQRLDTEYDKYRASIDDVYAAQLKYNKLSQTITQRNKAMGVSVEQTTMELEELRLKFAQVGVQMDAMGNVTSTVGRNFNQFGEVGQKSGKSMSRFNMQVQQGGYQLQDFVVQVQGGTSALTAFSQQGSQFAGIFGPAGAIVGAGIAIGSVLAQLGIAYLNNSEKADEAAEAQEALKQSLDSTLESLRANKVEWEELRSSMFSGETAFVDSMSAAAEDLAQAQAELSSMSEAVTAGSGLVGSILLNKALKEREEVQERVNQAQERYNEFVRLAAEETARFADDQANDLSNRLNLLEIERQFGEDSIQLRDEQFRIAREAYELELTQKDVTEETLQVLLEMFDAEESLTREIEKQKDTAEANLRLMQSIVESIEGIDFTNAIAGAETFGNKLLVAAQNAAAAMNAVVMSNLTSAPDGRVYSGRGSSTGAGTTESERFLMSQGGINVSDDRRIAESLKPQSSRSSGGGSGGGGGSSRDRLAELNAELAQRRELLSVFGAERDFLEAIHEVEKSLGDDRSKYSGEQIEILANQIIQLDQLEEAQKKAEQALKDRQKEQESIIKGMTDSFSTSYNSIVDGTMTVKEAFRSMAADVITQLHNILITQKLVGSFDAASGVGSGLAGFLGGFFADGAAFSGGNVVPFATGGVVSSATAFPMSGGRTGVMGEAGPEAIMPLTRGPDGSLGVKAQGGSGGSVTNITINAQGAQVGVAEQIEQKLRQVAPQIVGQSVVATKKSMQKTKKGWA